MSNSTLAVAAHDQISLKIIGNNAVYKVAWPARTSLHRSDEGDSLAALRADRRFDRRHPGKVFSAPQFAQRALLITSVCAISDIAAGMSSTRTVRIADAPAAADHSNYTKQRKTASSHLCSRTYFGAPSCD
jgi:hypothetical protein